MNEIIIDGVSYPLNDCSDLYLEPIVDLYSALTTDRVDLIDFRLVNKVCQSLKEVLLPSLSDTVISVNARDRYLWHLGFDTLAIAVLDIMAIKVQARLDKGYNQELESGLKFINLFRASLLQDESAIQTAQEALKKLLPQEQPVAIDNEADIKRQIEELKKKLPSVV